MRAAAEELRENCARRTERAVVVRVARKTFAGAVHALAVARARLGAAAALPALHERVGRGARHERAAAVGRQLERDAASEHRKQPYPHIRKPHIVAL